jgi:hypothetical protein
MGQPAIGRRIAVAYGLENARYADGTEIWDQCIESKLAAMGLARI